MGDCPASGELQNLIAGPQPPARQRSLERHLEACERCRRRLETLAGGPGVVPDRPAPGHGGLADSPALRRAVEQLQARPIPSEVSCPEGWEDGRPPFLRPADRTGFLGRLGPYEVRRLIGRGGMGLVFEALDPVLNRPVAVKVLSPLLAVSEQSRARFLREARAAATLTHENIVTIHTADQADGVLFLVLEYVPGESLADRLGRAGRLPVADVVRMGAQAARGLAAAHSKGLVHRDIKPANLLLEAGTDRVRIADFGLARTVAEEPLTLEGVVAGTPEFMSPEQACGAGVDARSDLFSLGTVLYTACTGSSPFRGESPLRTLEKVCREAPVPLGQVDPALPEWFSDLVHRLLEKDPRERIASAAELAEALAWPEPSPTVPGPAANRRAGSARGRTGGVLAALLVAAATLAAAVCTHLARPEENAARPGGAPEMGFVIAGRPETFRRLAEAIQAARDGDVIEVYGDGPFPTPPLRTEGRRLTIRAAGRSRPLFLPRTPDRRGTTDPFLSADADLRLEGLDLRWDFAAPPGQSEAESLARCALASTRGRLTLTHCRVVTGRLNGCVGGSGQQVVLQNCHLVAGHGGVCVFWRPAAEASLSAEGCVLEGPNAFMVFAVAETARPRPAQMTLTHNTVAAAKALHLRVDNGPRQPFTVTARHNIFGSSQLVLVRPLRPVRLADRAPTQLSEFLRSFGKWSDQANLYRRGMDYVVTTGGPRSAATLSAGVGSVGQWLRLWGSPANQSAEGSIRFHERPGSASLGPLRLAGVEHASGPVPDRVGARADTLGPGAAYHAARAAPADRPPLVPSGSR
jgi:hypothetical protein